MAGVGRTIARAYVDAVRTDIANLANFAGPSSSLFSMAVDRHNQDNPQNRLHALTRYMVNVRNTRPTPPRRRKRVKRKKKTNKKKKTFLPNSTKMPRTRTYRRKRTSRKRTQKIQTSMPKTQLVALRSTHLLSMDPGAAGATSFVSLNANNPIDPIDTTDSQSMTISSTEHHPKHWDQYEALYEHFEVTKFKAKIRYLVGNSQANWATFIVPTNEYNNTEIKAICQDTGEFATRLKEATRAASVKFFNGGTSTRPGHVNTVGQKTLDIKSLLGRNTTAADRVGNTAASDTEAAPGAVAKLYMGFGSLAAVDFTSAQVILDLEYTIRFSGLPDKEGVAV